MLDVIIDVSHHNGLHLDFQSGPDATWPSRRTRSSPLGVPGVCEGRSGVTSCLAMSRPPLSYSQTSGKASRTPS